MAEGTVSSYNYSYFIQWLRSLFEGKGEIVIPPNDENLASSQNYQAWLQAGRPNIPRMSAVEEGWQPTSVYNGAEWTTPTAAGVAASTTGTATTETAGGVGMGEPSVVDRDGWYFIQWTDAEGNVTYDPTPIGQVQGENALTEADKENIRLSEEQMKIDRMRLAQETAASSRERQLEWEGRLADLTQPSDWIARWTVENYDIPMSKAQQMTENAWVLLQEAQGLTGAERTMREMQSSRMSQQAFQLAAQAEAAVNPPTPDWLPSFAPSQTAGTPVSKGQVVTPSGQQWSQTPWSVREGLRGYMGWSGGKSYQDMLEKMAMTQPNTPYGAGRTSWSPATQRV